MMVAAVETRPTFAAALKDTRQACSLLERNYDVSLDGERFLMVKGIERESAATQLNVVLNWSEGLRRLLSENVSHGRKCLANRKRLS